MGTKIINRGRGPEIKGTRITVYDVLDYTKAGWHRDRIAALFRLSSRDIQAALDYIQQHQEVENRENRGQTTFDYVRKVWSVPDYSLPQKLDKLFIILQG